MLHGRMHARLGGASRRSRWIAAVAALAAGATILLASGPLFAYEVLSFSKTGDEAAIGGGSSAGDETPFTIDLLAAPPLPAFGSSAALTGRVELVFRLVEPGILRLGGGLAVFAEGYGSASARLTLSEVTDPSFPLVLLDASLPSELAALPRELIVDLQQAIGPGDYALVAEVSGYSINTLFLPYAHVIQGTGTAQATTELRVLPVPEPATALLLAIALACLGRRARSR